MLKNIESLLEEVSVDEFSKVEGGKKSEECKMAWIGCVNETALRANNLRTAQPHAVCAYMEKVCK